LGQGRDLRVVFRRLGRVLTAAGRYDKLMPKPHRNVGLVPIGDSLLPVKRRKAVPHEFVLEAIASLSPYTRPMFGCLAVYVEDKIVLILRDKPTNTADNGVWLATTAEHHESLRREFPHMRSIHVLRKPATGWQVLPADAPDFEAAALRACELVLAGDPRIGKVPGERRAARSQTKKSSKALKQLQTSKASAKGRAR
jgi:hypothetical protein